MTVAGKPSSGPWYAGHSASFDRFEHTHVGKGADQLGPGFYFTTRPQTAHAYGAYLVTATIVWKGVAQPYKRIPATLLQALMREVPTEQWDEEKYNWGTENPAAARKEVEKLLSPMWLIEVIDQLPGTIEWYGKQPSRILAVLVRAGYTGFVVRGGSTVREEQSRAAVGDEQWAVVWDPAAITIASSEERRPNPSIRDKFVDHLRASGEKYGFTVEVKPWRPVFRDMGTHVNLRREKGSGLTREIITIGVLLGPRGKFAGASVTTVGLFTTTDSKLESLPGVYGAISTYGTERKENPVDDSPPEQLYYVAAVKPPETAGRIIGRDLSYSEAEALRREHADSVNSLFHVSRTGRHENAARRNIFASTMDGGRLFVTGRENTDPSTRRSPVSRSWSRP
jgi:hypothetical protein